jgi:hypothetical protein
MTEPIHVVTENLREAAGKHRETAEYLSTIPSSHGEIQASLDSFGPIYRGLAEAGRQLLEERRRCYADQAAEHTAIAGNLDTVAAMWEQHERDAATEFRRLSDDH